MAAPAPPETWHPWQQVRGQRDPRLDGLRAFAILPVVVFHSTLFTHATEGAGGALARVTAMGTSGVDLFFVLSGFLITGILVESRGAANYYRAFYARRILRIFPLYYAVVIFCFVLLPQLTETADAAWMPGASRETWWYWTYLTNFHIALTGRTHHYFLDLTWSLAIEEQFYLVWPFVVVVCSPRRLLHVCLALIGVAVATRVGMLVAGASNSAIHTFPLCRVDSLAIGAAIALSVANSESRARLQLWAGRVLLPAAVMYLGYVLLFPFLPGLEEGALGKNPLGGDDPPALLYSQHPIHMALGYTVLAVIFGAVLVRVLSAPPGSFAARLLSRRLLVRIGRYSYAMYLLHLLAADLVRGLFDPYAHLDRFLPAQLFFYAAVLTVSYGLSAGSWHLLEAPVSRLRRFFPYEFQPAAIDSAADPAGGAS